MRKDFALCFDDGYVPYASVTIRSIADHAKAEDETVIHVVSDYISDGHKTFLCKVAGICKVEFHLVEDLSLFADVPVLGWGIYSWFRLLLPRVLPNEIHKILYLDCDVIVNESLDELFTMDMEGRSIAACIDKQAYEPMRYVKLGYDSSLRYICSGVLLMNLDYWRANNLVDKTIAFGRANATKIDFPDQDSINYVCRETKIILPPRYSALVTYFTYEPFIQEHHNQMMDMIDSPSIIHYAGYQPWLYHKNKSVHASLWWRTYYKLHAFPRIPCVYILHFFWYWAKVVGLKLKIFKRGSKFDVFGEYYNHPRIKKNQF